MLNIPLSLQSDDHWETVAHHKLITIKLSMKRVEFAWSSMSCFLLVITGHNWQEQIVHTNVYKSLKGIDGVCTHIHRHASICTLSKWWPSLQIFFSGQISVLQTIYKSVGYTESGESNSIVISFSMASAAISVLCGWEYSCVHKPFARLSLIRLCCSKCITQQLWHFTIKNAKWLTYTLANLLMLKPVKS